MVLHSFHLRQVEFGVNAEAQKFLSKSGETLTAAINAFTSDMNTLVNKTIEDTMINAKQYETARWVENTLGSVTPRIPEVLYRASEV